MPADINTLLAISFGSWAAVVAWIGRGVFRRLDTIANEMRSEGDKLNAYIVQTETRLAVLEDRAIKREERNQ